MKIALVTDIHIGARSASLLFAKHQIKFFKEVFIPKLIEENITTIICMGDVFDTRKFTNHAILHEWKREVFDSLAQFDIHLILGNHDISFRNSLDVNSPNLFLNEYTNIAIYKEATEVIFDGVTVVLSPWICAQNEKQTYELFGRTNAKTVFGHFEISGFDMHRGQTSHDGLPTSIFEKFDSVYSGHFHHRSNRGNINYIGNPYDLNWSDYNDPRGFCIFDTSTLEHEFIDNPNSVHVKFYYNDTVGGNEYYKGFDLENIENTFVKVIVVKKNDLYQFDQFINRLYNIRLADLKIIEDFDELQSSVVSDEHIDLEDTLTLVDTYINSIEIDGDKEKLKHIMKSLYLEASRL